MSLQEKMNEKYLRDDKNKIYFIEKLKEELNLVLRK